MTSWPWEYRSARADDSAEGFIEEDGVSGGLADLESHRDWPSAQRRRFWAPVLATAGMLLVVLALGTSGLPASLAEDRKVTQNFRPLQRYEETLPLSEAENTSEGDLDDASDGDDNSTSEEVFDAALQALEDEEDMDSEIGHLEFTDDTAMALVGASSNASEDSPEDWPSNTSTKGLLMDLRSNWHRLSGAQKNDTNKAVCSLNKALRARARARAVMRTSKSQHYKSAVQAQREAQTRVMVQLRIVLRTVMAIMRSLNPWYHRPLRNYGKVHSGGQAYGKHQVYTPVHGTPHHGYEKPYYGHGKPNHGYDKLHHGYEPDYGYEKKPYYGYDKSSHGYEKPHHGYEEPHYGYKKPYYGYDKPSDKPDYGYGASTNYHGYDQPNRGYPHHGYDKPDHGYNHIQQGVGYYDEQPCSTERFQCGTEPSHCSLHLPYCFRVSLASGESAPYDVMIGAVCTACDSDADCSLGSVCAEDTCCGTPGGRTCLPESAFAACDFEIEPPDPDTVAQFEWAQASLPFQNSTLGSHGIDTLSS